MLEAIDPDQPPLVSGRTTAYVAALADAGIPRRPRPGLRIPEDISINGIDDHPLAALTDLTTVRQPVPALNPRPEGDPRGAGSRARGDHLGVRTGVAGVRIVRRGGER